MEDDDKSDKLWIVWVLCGVGALLIAVLVWLCCVARKRKQKKQNDNHGPDDKKNINQLKCNMPRTHVAAPNQQKQPAKTVQVPRSLSQLKIARAQETQTQRSALSPTDSQRSRLAKPIAPLASGAKTGPVQAAETERKFANMSASTINYTHYEELPSVMSRTHLGSKHRCTGTVTSRTGLSVDAAAQASASASVAIGTSVNPDVGGRRLLSLSPLTTSKLNSAVEETQKLEGAQTRLPTPDTGEDLTGDCAGPRDLHSGLKIPDFDAVERNRKA